MPEQKKTVNEIRLERIREERNEAKASEGTSKAGCLVVLGASAFTYSMNTVGAIGLSGVGVGLGIGAFFAYRKIARLDKEEKAILNRMEMENDVRSRN